MSTDTVKTEVGSYFISNYPPYSQWNADDVPTVHDAMQAAPRSGTPLGLYVHIPFCRKRCKFCYFKVFTDKNANEIERYMAALSKEIELVSQLPVMGGRDFRFVYFGGGTPSYISVKQLQRLEERLRANISWDKAEEVTYECEPGTLAESKVHALKEFGVTRLSLGIENFNDDLLRENGRAHESPEVYRAWEWIEAADFPNVNIDLIAGMVGETWDNWKINVAKTIDMSPESVTIYQMELPFNTVYSQDLIGDNNAQSPVADWPTKRAWVSYAFDELSAAGYSVSSAYTMVKDTSKVNFSYRDNLFGGADLIATGIASFGHVSGMHYQNNAEWNGYLGELEAARLPVYRGLQATPHQLLVREVILLLKRGYLDADYFRQKFAVDILDRWEEVWREYENEQLLTIDGDEFRLTRQGLLLVDGLLPPFFEDQHQGVRYT